MKLLGHKVLFPLQTQVNPPQFSRTLGVCSLDRTNQKQYCLGDTHYGQGSKKNGLQRKKKWGEKKRMNGTKVQMHMRNIKKKMVQMSNALKILRGK